MAIVKTDHSYLPPAFTIKSARKRACKTEERFGPSGDG
jgi:hypothetical protein